MNKKYLGIAGGGVALIIGSMAVWHHNGHPGLDSQDHAAHINQDTSADVHAAGETDKPSDHDEHADHAAHGASNENLTLNDGKKWATDEPLRASMSRLHVAVIPPYKAFSNKTITTDQANALAATIKTEIDLIFANCKLEPKADAALHIVLADLLGGKAAIEANPSDPEGVPRIVNALHAYAEHFDHPNF